MTPSDLAVELSPVQDLARLARQWQALQARADGSFFLSWHWISTWLAQTGARPWLLEVRCGSQTVGMGLFHHRRQRRHGWLPVDALLLHQSGDPRQDALFVEYNGLLADRDFQPAVQRAFLDYIRDEQALLRHGIPCDEIHLGGVSMDYWRAARDMGIKTRLLDRKPTSAIDLQRGGAAQDLLAALSSNTRQQLRRSVRLYEARGPLELRAAEDVHTALAWLDELKTLHQKAWTTRGQPGAFANPFFESFHRQLLREGLDGGAVEVLRIAAGTQAIGYLYNFRWRDWVGNYASGFHYEDDARLKPGLVCLLQAAQWHQARGARVFDFMAGASRYKASLANTGSELVWLSLQRPALKFRVEDLLRAGAKLIPRGQDQK